MEQAMDVVRTNILREPWDVDRRLNEMQLTRKGLLVARDVALQESANATAFHPATLPAFAACSATRRCSGAIRNESVQVTSTSNADCHWLAFWPCHREHIRARPWLAKVSP
jgi:hypothetical protein